MRIWVDCDDEHLPLVCADISSRELLLAHPTAAVPECLADFGVPTCSANAAILFEVRPGCGLMRGLRLGSQRSALPDR